MKIHLKRWLALFLVLTLCLPYTTGLVSAEEAEPSVTETSAEAEAPAENGLEDPSAQLGERTEPAGTETPETEPAEAEPAGTEPAEAAPVETAPVMTEPIQKGTSPIFPVGADPVPNEGRDYAGQVTLTVDGVEYILIGTWQQLKALDYYPEFAAAGSLAENSAALTDNRRYDVMGPIWYVHETRSSLSDEWTPEYTLVYPGDADLVGDYAGYELYGVSGALPSQAGEHAGKKLGDKSTVYDLATYERWIYVGGTLTAPNMSTTSYSYGKYNPKGNFIVFRDIDMRPVTDWEPLMFYGIMLGVKGAALNESALPTQKLSAAVTAITTSRRSRDYAGSAEGEWKLKQPTISNVTVTTSGELDPSTYVGVGFFASVTSNRPGSDFSFTPIRAEVRNLRLKDVTVTNGFTGIYVEQTLVNLLTDGLGKVVGKLLDVLLPILLQGSTTQYTNFTESLSNLLAARQREISNMATGGFTGRVDGDVLIENCDLDGVQVTSGYGHTGGFVGYSTGCEQYLPVTGPLLKILEILLNLIPGLGLGDLITVVSHLLNINYLIPMDYLNPEISDCDVFHLTGDIGPAQEDLDNANFEYRLSGGIGDDHTLADTGFVTGNGGFVGVKVATMMVNCSVQDSDFTVWAYKYGGGFAGLARDAVIQELLSGLGLDIITTITENLDSANLQSVQLRCNIQNSNVTVKGFECLGGFNGAMANAFCVNNEVNTTPESQGKKFLVVGAYDLIGGFAGIATLGWAMNLGNQDSPTNEDLLSTLTHVLGSLSGNFEDSLLDLVGVGQSYILGLQSGYYTNAQGENVETTEFEVVGRDFVGGLVGGGDALYMSGVSADLLNEITYFAHGDLTAWDAFPDMPAKETFTVTYKVMQGGQYNGENPVSVGPDQNHQLTLPGAATGEQLGVVAPYGYTFVGWVTGNYNHDERMPTKVYQPGETILVTSDLTLKALFSKEGAVAYELVTEEPESARDWGGDYVITHNVSGDIRVLTGLSSGYYADSANGAKTLAEAGIQVNPKHSNFLTGVGDDYVFTATKAALSGQDYYFQNKGTGTYLSTEDVDLDSSLFGTDYIGKLYAATSRSTTESQWALGIRTEIGAEDTYRDYYALLLQSDTIHVTDWYLAFDTETNRFSVAKGDSANPSVRNIYLWRKSQLPTTYTTMAENEVLNEADLVISDIESYIGMFKHLHGYGVKVVDGYRYVGGVIGLADTASVSSLLGNTVGVGSFKLFDFSEIHVVGSNSDGLTVVGADYYVGGAIGMAMGGNIHVGAPNEHGIELQRLKLVQGLNCVGGFAGCVGPGEIANSGGLDVKLLGFSLVKANNLLKLGAGLETKIDHGIVEGIPEGYTVEATGDVEHNTLAVYCAGGFFGRSNSTQASNCHAINLKWVKANDVEGRAGGFLGVSEVGGLASLDDEEGTAIQDLLGNQGGLVQADNLLNAVEYLIPEYTTVDVTFVNGGFVEAAYAGGFAADFQSGTVDNSAKDEDDWYAVYNIDYVSATLFGGGFAGKLFSGALADAAGGVSILGGLKTPGGQSINLNISGLLDVLDVYIPKIIKAGVKSESRYTITAPNTEDEDLEEHQPGFVVRVSGGDSEKTTGAAGGFAGYMSGAQISYCDVRQLRHTDVTPPKDDQGNDALESKDGSNYFNLSSYAVVGTRYAGGYVGFLDIGSSASLGKGLGVLGGLSADNVLGALDVVVSTVEHSDVYGGPGGFAVLATWDAPAPDDFSILDLINSGDSGDSGDSGSDPQTDNGNLVAVYVVDQSNCSKLIAKPWNNETGDQLDPIEPTLLGTDRNGDKLYVFTVDASLYNRVTFSESLHAEHTNSSDDCLKLDSAVRVNRVIPAYNSASWVVTANGTDIWYPADKEEAEGCRGKYNHYTSVTGAEKCEEIDPDNNSHTFSSWMPRDGVNRHYHFCYDCGYVEEESCTITNDYCSVCGRRDATLPGSIEEAQGLVGRAGGFVGWLRGSHIQDCNAWNFCYIVGQIAAGGYAGEIEPGSVAEAIGDTTLLFGLAEVSGGLAAIGQEMIATIRNSVTTCIPCGGAVRANAASDAETQRGMAGGYVGHNCGGEIWGNSDATWKEEYDPTDPDKKYNGPKSECAAIRILSVWGYEYAGGFTGLMEPGSTAGTGNISLLFDLVRLDSPLDALRVSYPTEENTAVYGPLYGLDMATWNLWVDYVGRYGGYGLNMKKYTDQAEFEADLDSYLYGYHVMAGRDEYSTVAHIAVAGCAGGYVGSMRSGVVTNGIGHNAKQVVAMRHAGGFAGEMKTGSVASLGEVGLLNMDADLGSILTGALEVFVPVAKSSSVEGVQSGLTVWATGEPADGCGNAGGYVGSARGVQIWGKYAVDEAGTPLDNSDDVLVGAGCNITNLKKVMGSRYVGGFIGTLSSGSTAEVGTNDVSDGPLQDILDFVVSSGRADAGTLVSAAQATVSTVRYTSVSALKEDGVKAVWGFTVGGYNKTVTEGETPTTVAVRPLFAGGYVGAVEGAVIGSNDDIDSTTVVNVSVQGLRGVDGQYYAGGFAGIASMDGAASVAKEKASILSFIDLGSTSALSMFRTYIHNAEVVGVDEGFTVKATEYDRTGIMNSTSYSGCAGGFAGALISGEVTKSHVRNLSSVEGLNYVGGFVGHSGKTGVANVDNLDVASMINLANAQAGVGEVIKSHIEDSSVSGVDDYYGFTVTAKGKTETVTIGEGDQQQTVEVVQGEQAAGGFVGYSDLAEIGFLEGAGPDDRTPHPCSVENLKYVKSDQYAGGFIGKTDKGYLVEVQASSVLVGGLLLVVNTLVKALYLDNLQSLLPSLKDAIVAITGSNPEDVQVNLALLGDDSVLTLQIGEFILSVELSKGNGEGGTDVATIHLGDSVIKLPCNEDGLLDPENSNATIQLFPVAYVKIVNTTVTGIDRGYDVFGGGADQDHNGKHTNGYAGGFVGYSHVSEIRDSAVKKCDVVRGTPALLTLTDALSASIQRVGPFTGYYNFDSVYSSLSQGERETGDTYEYEGVDKPHTASDNNAAALLNKPFETSAKLVLMDDEILPPNPQSLNVEPADMQNPCLPVVDLTLHKVWDDFDHVLTGATRPMDTVTYQVYQVQVTVDGEGHYHYSEPVEYGEPVTLSLEDANAFTENVWTKKLTGLPASATVGGQLVHYGYYALETDSGAYLGGTPELADISVTDKFAFYTFDEQNDKGAGYVVKITNYGNLTNQIIVVDYGIPVPVNAAEYFQEMIRRLYDRPVELTLEAISAVELGKTAMVMDGNYQKQKMEEDQPVFDAENNPVMENLDKLTSIAPGESLDTAAARNLLKYGNAALVTRNVGTEDAPSLVKKLSYQPSTMRMSAEDVVYVAVKRVLDGVFVYGSVTFVPASIMYYEDTFITFSNGIDKNGDPVVWEDTGDYDENAVQGEDRPDTDEILTGLGLDENNVYGYDAAYDNCSTYSLSNAKVITVSKGMKTWPTAEFVFTGTGFDLLAVTSGGTGYMNVDVYDSQGVLRYCWGVDTFYGAKRELNSEYPYARYLCIWNGQRWSAVVSNVSEIPEEEPDNIPRLGQFPVNPVEGKRERWPADVDTFVVYQPNYKWTFDTSEDAENTLYQIPVISSNGVDMPYDTYTVRITPIYSMLFDHNDSGDFYKLYLDAVRVYSPAPDSFNETYYTLDHEGWPQFIEMRKLLLDQNSLGAGAQPGIVFIDGLGNDSNVGDYNTLGPNNEIYLQPGQAVAFALKTDMALVKGETEKDQDLPEKLDQIHISMKKVFSADPAAKVSILGHEIAFSTATECYYNITDLVQWEEDGTGSKTGIIVISNPLDSGAVISMRNLKITYTSEPEVREDDQGDVVYDELLRVWVDPNETPDTLDDNALLPALLNEGEVFKLISMSLENDLAIHFYVPAELLENASIAYVLFSQDGVEQGCEYDYTLAEADLNGDGVPESYRVYTYRVAAKDMGSVVSGRLFYRINSVEYISAEVASTSVRAYATEQLAQAAAAGDAELQQLMVDLLNYGAAAQIYAGVPSLIPNPNYVDDETTPDEPQLIRNPELVNADLTEDQRNMVNREIDPALTPDNEHREVLEGAVVNLPAATLVLEDRINLKFYVDLADSGFNRTSVELRLTYEDLDGATQTAVIGGNMFTATTLGNYPIEGSSKDMYAAEFDGLNAAQLRTVVKAQVYKDGEPVSDALSYSVETYACKMIAREGVSETLKTLLKAMMLYGDSANAYFTRP